MERKPAVKKKTSITRIFTVYIGVFTLFVVGVFAAVNLYLAIGMTRGFILPADYMEKAINHGIENMESYSSYEEWIPDGAEYAVFDKDGSVLEKNCDDKDTGMLWNNYLDRVPVEGGRYYKYVESGDEVCVIQYYIYPRFKDPDMYRICKNPERTGMVISIICFMAGIIVLKKSLSRRVGREFDRFNTAISEIEMDNLDFQIKGSDIKEINELIESFNRMKNGLKDSLNSQWKMEQQKKLQTAALAHDIKTPLTILKGSAELMEETDLQEEQQEYNDNIMRNVDIIESYIVRLIDVMKAESNMVVVRKKINFKDFIKSLSDDINAMTVPRNLKSRIITGELPESFATDEGALKRALMNIVSNAVEYSEGEVSVTVDCVDNFISFIVEDSGRGMSQEDIAHAMEEFYQGDKSRKGTKHYGLGLYIAGKMINSLGGEVILGNSKSLGGARIELKVPVEA